MDDLPAPDGPTMPMASPLLTSKFTRAAPVNRAVSERDIGIDGPDPAERTVPSRCGVGPVAVEGSEIWSMKGTRSSIAVRAVWSCWA